MKREGKKRFLSLPCPSPSPSIPLFLLSVSLSRPNVLDEHARKRLLRRLHCCVFAQLDVLFKGYGHFINIIITLCLNSCVYFVRSQLFRYSNV